MRNSKAIKEEAVARIRSNAEPLLVLAREYGVSTNTLRAWLRESQMRSRAQEEANRIARSLSSPLQSELSQRERLLMHAMEYSPATIIITDAEGKIVYANPKLTETTGYDVEEVIGQNPRILKSGETSNDDYRQLWKTIMSGKVWRGTFRNRRKDGTLYWERASISPVYDSQGHIAHFMAVKENITDFVKAEQAHRQTAASFLAVISALPHALLVIDQLGRILLANEQAEAILDSELPQGTRINALKPQWRDNNGKPLPESRQPLSAVLSGDTGMRILRQEIGITLTGAPVRWHRSSLRMVQLPEADEIAALLIIEPSE